MRPSMPFVRTSGRRESNSTIHHPRRGNDEVFGKSSIRLVSYVLAAGIVFVPMAYAGWDDGLSQTELIRNGGFELGEAGWAMNTGGIYRTYLDSGKEGAGLRITTGDVSPFRGYALQELHLPANLASAALEFDCRFDTISNAPQLAEFGVGIITDTETLAGLYVVDSNNFPGYDWQAVSVNLDADAISKINAARTGENRVYVIFNLVAMNLGAIVDNISLKADGSMTYPDLTGGIAYIDGANDIYRIQPDGGNETPLWLAEDANDTVYDLAWNPAADMLAFTSDFEYGTSRFSSDIYTMLPDGSGVQRHTNPPSAVEMPGGYATGVIRGRVHNNTGRYTIALVYIQGADGAVQLAATLAPDTNAGDTQEFVAANVADLGPGVEQTVTVWADGYAETSVTVDVIAGAELDVGAIEYHGYTTRFHASDLTWSGDGLEIGFALDSLLRRTSSQRTFGLSDSPLLNVTTIAADPAWSPVSNQFLYTRTFASENNGIYLTDVGSSDAGERLVAADYAGTNVKHPAWLPDGSGFIFVMDRGGPRN